MTQGTIHVVDALAPDAGLQKIDHEAWRMATDTVDLVRTTTNVDELHSLLAKRFQTAIHTGERRIVSRVVPHLSRLATTIESFSPERRSGSRTGQGGGGA